MGDMGDGDHRLRDPRQDLDWLIPFSGAGGAGVRHYAHAPLRRRGAEELSRQTAVVGARRTLSGHLKRDSGTQGAM